MLTKYHIGICKYIFLFLFGGFTYFYMEILYRGFSHFSMILCGGFSLILCGLLNQSKHIHLPLYVQMLFSACIITLLELFTGYIVNVRFHLNVWDYSNLPYNFYGQICLGFSALWFFLSFFCIMFDDLIRWKIFNEEKPEYLYLLSPKHKKS